MRIGGQFLRMAGSDVVVYPCEISDLNGQVAINFERGAVADRLPPEMDIKSFDYIRVGELLLSFDHEPERLTSAQLDRLTCYVDNIYHDAAIARQIEAVREVLMKGKLPASTIALVTMTISERGEANYGFSFASGDTAKTTIGQSIHHQYDASYQVVARVFADGRVERKQDAEVLDVELKPIPADIRTFAERFCILAGVDSAPGADASGEDRLFVANLVAKLCERGDGRGRFYGAGELNDDSLVIGNEAARRIADELCRHYALKLTIANNVQTKQGRALLQEKVEWLLKRNIGVARDTVEIHYGHSAEARLRSAACKNKGASC